MSQQRGLYRVAINLNGTLHQGADSTPCDVLDMTEKGLRFRTSAHVALHEELQLKLTLADNRPIACTVQITNVASPFFGARIVGISPEHQQQLSQFIDQLIALNLAGF